MSEAAAPPGADSDNAVYVGAIATLVIGLAPYVNVFIFPAYVMGAFIAVRYATRARNRTLLFKEGARLGFLSTFLGAICLAVVVDLVWLFADYQLWQKQNSDLILAIAGLFAGPVILDEMRNKFAEQAVTPFQWYIFLLQLIGNAIFCGIFGTLAGVLAVKLFRPRAA